MKNSSYRAGLCLWLPDLSDLVETLPRPDQRQLLSTYGLRMFEQSSGDFTCASCTNFDAEMRYCTLRSFGTRGEIVACEVYDPRMKRSA